MRKFMRFKAFIIILSVTSFLFSCRKNDEKYEGYYSGIEEYTETDSGATVTSFDTSYIQAFEVTYDRKFYYFEKLEIGSAENNEVFSLHKNDIVNHEHLGHGNLYYDSNGDFVGGSGSLKFIGDSLYIFRSNYHNGDSKNTVFKGKRN